MPSKTLTRIIWYIKGVIDMAIYIGECEVKLYKGDYQSAALYIGDKCIIPKEEEKEE